MRTSKKKINKNLARQIYRLLYQVIADTHNPKEVEEFFKDFLSETELEILAKRLAIAYWLNKSRNYENIKTNLSVSSTTIATVVQQMKKPGFKKALEKIHADEWATLWAKKIGKVMKFGRK